MTSGRPALTGVCCGARLRASAGHQPAAAGATSASKPTQNEQQKGTNPQWEDLAVDEVFTAAPDKHPEGYGDGAWQLLDEWASVIAGTKAEMTVPPESVVRVQMLLDAIYASSKEGRRIELPPQPK
jgi:predicted dehydrogenase